MSEMAGIEKPTYLYAYGLMAPKRLLIPDFTPWRQRNGPLPPRYVPQPQPEGTSRVVLGDDYYLHEYWEDYDERRTQSPEDVFDIPAEQREHWEAVCYAYQEMQDEIREMIESRNPPR